MRSPIARTILVAVVAAALGAIGGYWAGERDARDRQVQTRDLFTALRAAELSNRLTVLRMIRKGQTTPEDIESLEISAIVLLDSIALDEVTETYQSFGVLRRVAQALGAYMKDYPKSQFSEPRHASVPKLVALGTRP